MSQPKMHADEVDIDVALVRRLLTAQFPQWAGLAIESVASTGTVNAMFRLGSELAVRLPRVQEWAGDLRKELHWLPKLAPLLPIAVPQPVAQGRPGEGYPFHWGVYQWLKGESWTPRPGDDLRKTAVDLARFIIALQQVDATGGPKPYPGGGGAPLADGDPQVCAAIAASRALVDTEAVTAAWEIALAATPWRGTPVLVHADLKPANLLAVDGQLTAVIDFGGLCVGDPACDIAAAWTLFSGESRSAFRDAMTVDDATWARGRVGVQVIHRVVGAAFK